MNTKYATAPDENGTSYFGTVNPKNNKIVPVGKNTTVTNKFVDIDTGDVEFTLEYVNLNAPPTPVTTNGKQLIDDLNRKGYLVGKNTSDIVTDYVREQLDDLQPINVYRNLGWRLKDGKLQFRGHTLLTADNATAGNYVGDYDIAPRGTKEELIADMQKCILGNPYLELSMILGLSSCVVGYLGCFSTVETLVANIYGRSTTGKTTCSNLAVSMCCNPSPGEGKQSLSNTWYGTENGLFATMAQNCGFTILFDEIGMKDKDLDVVNFIYGICSGKPKARARKSGSLAMRRSWNTTFISTGEHSIFTDSKPPDGMNVRVLNFGNMQWTKSPEQCREIERFTQKHCGLPVMLLADYMLTLDSQDVRNRCQKLIDNLITEMDTKKDYKDRIAKIIARLLLTGELFSECCQVQFNIESLKKILLDVVKKSTPESESIRAYDDILQMVELNRDKFQFYLGKKEHISTEYDELLPSKKKQCYGAIIKMTENFRIPQSFDYTQERKIYILSTVFDSWMNELGYQNKENILREWRTSGLIETKDKTHIRCKVRLYDGGPMVPCVCIIIKVCRELEEREMIISCVDVFGQEVVKCISDCMDYDFYSTDYRKYPKNPNDVELVGKAQLRIAIRSDIKRFLHEYVTIKFDKDKYLKYVEKEMKSNITSPPSMMEQIMRDLDEIDKL